jgi:DNA-binding CsgD family transcriptional regulator
MNDPQRQHWNTLHPTERQALNRQLTNSQHACYTLWLAGLVYERIATALNISRSTAVTHVRRARAIHRTIKEPTL